MNGYTCDNSYALINLIPNIPKHLSCAHPSRNPTIAIPHNLSMKKGEKGAMSDNLVNNQILSTWINHIYYE